MKHTKEDLEYFSSNQAEAEQKAEEEYHERPLMHRILAWVLIAIVLFAFLGTCYWLVNFGRP